MPLQKSFSEQSRSLRVSLVQSMRRVANLSKQHRPQWQRNKTYSGLQSREDGRTPQGEQSPMPVSMITKNKLNTFQFGLSAKDEGAMGKQLCEPLNSDNKENAPVGELHASVRLAKSEVKQIEEHFAAGKDVPTTPAGRLALPDLIGMVDLQTVELEISPDERVMWNPDISTTPSSASPYNVTRRNQKRARSSSPTSSPAHTFSELGAKGAVFNLQTLNSSLTTPQVDPGRDLWARYASGTDKSISKAPVNPAIANLMYISSPQNPNTGNSRPEGTFRRSNSCGTQWPKRRKVYDEQLGDDIFSESLNAGPSKHSLVSALLGKVQEGYDSAVKSNPSSYPSRSSPTPGKEVAINQEEDLSQQSIFNDEAQAFPNPNSTIPEAKEPLIESKDMADSSSSDYGEFEDDVFDDSIMDVTELSKSAPASNSLSKPILSAESIVYQRVNVSYIVPDKSETSFGIKEEDEEFGDVDDENFAADLEDMFAKYDSQPLKETNKFPVEVESNIVRTERREQTQFAAYDNLKADSDDEYGGDFDDADFAVAEAVATQTLHQSASSLSYPTHKARAIQRYLVTNVLDSQYENMKGRLCPEKVLFVQLENSKEVTTILLRDGWFETPVTVKAFVHVIGEFIAGQCIIDDMHNMLILHPDHLISATVVADSFSCTRRAVLQDRVKATSDSSAPLVYGTILHEIFQAAMMANKWDSEWLAQLVETIAKRHIEDLYTIKVEIAAAVEYLSSKMGELQSWAELFVRFQPRADAIVKAGNGESANMCVTKLLDVEEHVWSPMYGLKGNIDATVQVTMQDGKKMRTLTVPFEVKTGKTANAAHRAQTALYNLLLSDRYDVEIAYGILYYMETSETSRIPAIRHEIRHMIMQRNELACFVRERDAQLPPMLQKQSLCNRCYAKVPCFIYHRLADDGTGETSGMNEKFDEIVKHLTPRHKEFFLKWDDLLTKEEKESLKFRRELWTMLSTQREKLGRCFANVIIEPGSAYEEQNNPKINRFRYTLIKKSSPPGFSFLDSQIIVGEPIVISDEKGHFALANGYVTHVRKQRITVAVDRRLHNARSRRPGFDATNNQVFASIMEVVGEGCTPDLMEDKVVEPPVQYRLDKDEFSNGMATVRNNIIQVMADGPFGSREIRGLVVDLKPPQFKPHSTAYSLTDRANINVDQRRAIEKVMSAQDYALVLGMPGTGKTTTIAHIIRALVSQRKSVLLTSYTHTAVDNILLKLRDDNISILRLGSIAKIHTDVQEFAVLAAKPKATFEELRSSWHDSPIVATTCLGINHPIFNERTFDYCIVDEASQITLPVCLGPIRMARTFILVGDHNQLPPLVQNEEARVGGLDISLFKQLSDAHPSSVVNLEHQYRMCEDVMALSNSLIYNGRLKCGTPEVAAKSLAIPNVDALKNHHYTPSTISRSQKSICPAAVPGRCWIRDLLDPSLKVSFINTDPLLPVSREQAKGNRIVNTTEATICIQLVESLLSVGVPASTIGVMTHYRSQLALLKHGLRGHPEVEMHTADRFQGRDKEVVILSLVRSNEGKNIGELLKDWRRINVAFTRAKTKLLVVGSRETLKGNNSEEMVSKFVGLMEERKWVYDLPKGAVECHLFDDGATQVTASGASRPGGTQWRPIGEGQTKGVSPKKGRENIKGEPRTALAGERVLFKGRPVLRDIVNDTGYTLV